MSTRAFSEPTLRLGLGGLFCMLLFSVGGPSFAAEHDNVTADSLRTTIQKEGRARVVVKLRMSQQRRNANALANLSAVSYRAEIRSKQQNVRDRLWGTAHRVRREFRSLPYVALDVDAVGLARLETAVVDVQGIYEDILVEPLLSESIFQIEADLAHATGGDGTGTAVVVIDTGVDKDHPFLSNKLLAEACFAFDEDGITGACPNGQPTQLTTGAGAPCAFAPDTCRHGTHVAGIAAGTGPDFTGVAPAADLIAIQVFHQSSLCFGRPDCASAFMSDIAAALEHVYDIHDQYPIASVNMSIGGGSYTSECDATFPFILDAINNLKSVGIATVVASGNSSTTDAISSPACVSSAISVSAVDEGDVVANFASVSNDLDLFAPGTSIISSIPGVEYASFSGTSMATPHVAGAWAVLAQMYPDSTVDENLLLLETTGKLVADHRPGAGVARPRIRLSGAVGIENPVPVVSTVTPSSLNAWGPQTTLVINGSGFARSSVILLNGQPVTTTLVSETELRATLTVEFLQTSATSFDVQVQSPLPGGGTTNPIPLAVLQPDLAVNKSSAIPGESITVTLSNAPGRQSDWMSFALVGAPDTALDNWIYVPTAVQTTSWTVDAPSQLGNYEFRLYSNDQYTRITTSPMVSVQSPSPGITSLAPARVAAGRGNLSLTVNGAGFTSASEVRVGGVARSTTFLSSTQLIAVLPASDFSTSATSLGIDVYTPAPGGGTSNTFSLGIAHPVLVPSKTSVAPGESVTVTLTDGVGNDFDWIALARTGASNGSFVEWTYVGAGQTSAVWTITMPTATGNYEFRLFENDQFIRLATSVIVAVEDVPPEPPSPPSQPVIDVSATQVSGGDMVTVTMTGGPGNTYDWLALAAVGAPNTSYLSFVYVDAGATTATWTVTMPSEAGDYEIRLFENNGYTRLATSATITVSGEDPLPPPEPVIDVSATQVSGGDMVTVTLTGGPGNAVDWLALAGVGDPNTTYLDWVYVASGATTATWTVTMPATLGDYEFRLFENGGYTRLATSPTVTVGQ